MERNEKVGVAILGLGLAMLSFLIDRLDFYEMNKIAKQEKAP